MPTPLYMDVHRPTGHHRTVTPPGSGRPDGQRGRPGRSRTSSEGTFLASFVNRPLGITLVMLVLGRATGQAPCASGWIPGIAGLDASDGSIRCFAVYDDGQGPMLY